MSKRISKKSKQRNEKLAAPYVENLHMDVDYEKLAKAIAKAQLEAEQEKRETIQKGWEESRKKSSKNGDLKEFARIVKAVLLGKGKSNGTVTSSLLGGTISAVFNLLAIALLVLIIILLVALLINIPQRPWAVSWSIMSIVGNFSLYADCLFDFSILFFMFMIAVVFKAIANELIIETDRNYIIAVFSSFTGFVALIIAVIALFIRR